MHKKLIFIFFLAVGKYCNFIISVYTAAQLLYIPTAHIIEGLEKQQRRSQMHV
jgi:hypothetical protein